LPSLTEEYRVTRADDRLPQGNQPHHDESAAADGSRQSMTPAEEQEPPVAGLRARLGKALSREGAAELLEQTGGRLLELRNKGTVRVQRVLGRASTLLPPTPLGALCGVFDTLPLSAETVLLGYSQGIYPLDFADRALRWHCPPERFVVYLKELRISSNMRRELKRASYDVSFDQAPRDVLAACADRAEGTWLSQRLQQIYMELFEMGAMHSVEAWKDGELVGGSFGVSIGRVWTSESMFHRAPHAGKVQFAAVAQHLTERGVECVDGQQYSEHFARFGAREIPIEEYRNVLARGLAAPVSFHAEGQRPARRDEKSSVEASPKSDRTLRAERRSLPPGGASGAA
jgi:leucyl/phenylalanyl-tRNA---protein transferase